MHLYIGNPPLPGSILSVLLAFWQCKALWQAKWRRRQVGKQHEHRTATCTGHLSSVWQMADGTLLNGINPEISGNKNNGSSCWSLNSCLTNMPWNMINKQWFMNSHHFRPWIPIASPGRPCGDQPVGRSPLTLNHQELAKDLCWELAVLAAKGHQVWNEILVVSVGEVDPFSWQNTHVFSPLP